MSPKPGVADIAELRLVWESTQDVRQLVLNTGSVFKTKSDGQPVSPNVAGAALNVPTLIPLMQRLADPQGNVNMVCIADLEAENLGTR
jgi:hypothetical protein